MDTDTNAVDSLQNPLLPVLVGRLNRTEQITPRFIGKYSGIEALPRQSYPPIYWWLNTSIQKPVLTLNTPLLLDICKDGCAKSNLDFDDVVADVALHAIEILNTVSHQNFEKCWPVYEAELYAAEKKGWLGRIKSIFE